MCPDNTNDRPRDDDSESILGTGAQALAVSARRDPDEPVDICRAFYITQFAAELT